MDFNQQFNGYPTVRGDMQQRTYGQQYQYGNNNLYDNYASQMTQQKLSNQFLKCRPVASKEEARAYQIDLDGSLWVFTDVGNGKIYTKQINTDGTATFKTYVFNEDENPYNSSDYVTKSQFNKVVQKIVAAIGNNNNTVPQQSVDNITNQPTVF